MRLRFTAEGIYEVVTGQRQLAQGTKEQAEEVEKLARSQAELGRITNKVMRDNETAQERLKRLLDEVSEAHEHGRLTTEQRQQAVTRLNEEFENSTGQFAKFRDEDEKTFGVAAIRKLATYAGAIFTIQEAISAVTAEFRAQQQAVNDASTAQISISQARSILNSNLLGSTFDERLDVQRRFGEIGAEFFLPREVTTRAAAASITTAAGDVEQALAATRIAASINQIVPDQIPATSQGIIEILKLRQDADAEAAFGLVTSVGALGNIADLDRQARNIPGAIAGAVAYGSTIPGAGAFTAFLSQALPDPFGERTRTANPRVAQRLAEFDFGVPAAEAAARQARSVTIESGALGQRQIDRINATQQDLERRRQLAAGNNRLNTLQRVTQLQQQPDLGAEFVAGGGFGEANAVITDLILNPGGLRDRQLRSFVAGIPRTDEALRAAAADQISGQLADPLRAAAIQAQALDFAVETALVEEVPTELLSERQREQFQQLQQLFGGTRFAARASDIIQGITGGGVTFGEGISRLRGFESRLRQGTIPFPGGFEAGFGTGTIPAGSEAIQTADRLDRILDIMERSVEETEKTNRILENSRGGLLVGDQ